MHQGLKHTSSPRIIPEVIPSGPVTIQWIQAVVCKGIDNKMHGIAKLHVIHSGYISEKNQ